jgi:hypothetical protein
MSEDWAQVAVRCSLAASSTKQPVSNVLSIQGTANANGQLTVDITPDGGTPASVTANVVNADTAEQMASKLASAISTVSGLSATHHCHQSQWLVLVNKGNEVTFANIASSVPSVTFIEPVLNFNDDINLLEGSVLGLNFMDSDNKTVDMIAVKDIQVLGRDAAAGGDYLAASLPGWRNVAILRETVVDGNDASCPTGAGHEMGHVLFDVGNAGHSSTSYNLFYASETANVPETLASPKRLTDAQNTDARTDSGPSTTPPLLQKK